MNTVVNRCGFWIACVWVLAMGLLLVAVASPARAAEIWSVNDTLEALQDNKAVLIDIRSREEWAETGVAEGAWPVSMHERGFVERLQAVQEIAGDRTVALICATGGRSAYLARALEKNGFTAPFVDVSEGMMGSRRGPGWIRAGLPLVTIDAAMDALPEPLKAESTQ